MARETDTGASTREQATRWWTLLHGEGASAADHNEFGSWVSRSPERIAAYLEIARLMRALRSPGVRWPDTPTEVLIREAKASSPEPIPLARGREPGNAGSSGVAREIPRGGDTHPVGSPGNDRPVRRLAWLAAAAAMALVFAAGWLLTAGPQHYSTRFGEQRSILLDDGSRVTLNTASKIVVDLQKKRRIVRLLQGEALFEVSHDPTRPFDVYVSNEVVRAIGTQFNIDVRRTQTTVTVLEGRVALLPETRSLALSPGDSSPAIRASRPPTDRSIEHEFPAPADALILTAAERVIITPTGTGLPQHVANPAAAASWTQRRLVFDHRPLSEVADELNRYSRRRIVIDSPELDKQEVTGVIQLDDPSSFLSFLSDVPGVEIHDAADGARIVTLRPRAARSSEPR